MKRIEKDDSLWDQNAFNDLKGLDGGCQYTPDGTGLGPGYGGKVQAGHQVRLFTQHTYSLDLRVNSGIHVLYTVSYWW